MYQELDGTSAAVFHSSRKLQRLLAHLLACDFIEEHGRRLLEHLLVPALYGALALVKVNAVAMPIKQYLTRSGGTIGQMVSANHCQDTGH